MPDPYKGKPATAAGASRFQTDHLALPDTAAAAAAAAAGCPALPGPGPGGAPGSGAGTAALPPATAAAGAAAAAAAAAAEGPGEVVDAGALADAFLGSLGQEVRALLFYHHRLF